jgi:ATP-dependent DNA helicase RecG
VSRLRLDTPVQYVRGVGPVRAEQLGQLGIQTVEDLLLYFPFRFDLRKQAQPIGSLRGDEESATVAGQVVFAENKPWGRKPLFSAQLQDDSGFCLLKWFHGGYLAEKIRPGMQLAASGKVSVYRETLQMINPRFQIVYDPEQADFDRDELLPVYPAGAKLTSQTIGSIIRKALPEVIDLFGEWFRDEYRDRRGLMARGRAVEAMHHPENREQWAAARRRFAYEECLLLQLGVALMRMRQVSRPAHPLILTDQIDQRIRARFPFQLTDAQQTVCREIAADLARDRPMNRLVQGDVGSGKTVVALHAALLAVARKKQAALMAPTEVLADQHFRKIRRYLDGSRVRVERLTGSMPPRQRKRILDGLASGQIHIVVGTQALLSEGVKFAALALVIVDEQHKFGVRQRSGIRSKGYAPHYLVMTATPIPRTLALTLFGDLDVSTIDQLPPGRGTTETRLLAPDRLEEAYEQVRQRLDAGDQAYFIYPLVTASDQLELTAAVDAARDLAAGPFADYGVGLIHGQMSQEKKHEVMQQFAAGQIQLLVASVVVEVGLDVANANVMLVQHAERFGLAQLHQLRGRIGRGEQDALCLLVAEPNNPLARKRLDVLVETDDGFELAEQDLRIRGPGEFFGTRQHGLPELRIADLIEDFDLLRMARRDAFEIVDQDPGLNLPHHQALRSAMVSTYAGRLELLAGA